MRLKFAIENIVLSDVGILILLASARILFHLLTDGQYGFHRDELAILDDARYLAWGYVAYPPFTPFVARVALGLFGPSLVGIRFFSALAQGVVLVMTGLMARELGGGRLALVTAALAVAIAPASLAQGALFQYVSFDYMWWVLLAYLLIRLLKSQDPRGWLGIGIVVGLGMLTKYTMLFFAAGMVGGVLLTPARQYLKSRWLWAGVTLALIVFSPNLLWQFQNDFVSLTQLATIHAHDISIGRAEGFIEQQFFIGANFATVPLWIAGLYFCFFSKLGQRFRVIGWMFVIPFVLLLLMQGRSYYLAPAYPMLLAGGAALFEQWCARLAIGWSRLLRVTTIAAFAFGGGLMGLVALPLAPLGSPMWDIVSNINADLKEEIGWPELAETVARIQNGLPDEEQARAGILTYNYGEAGALNLYGPRYGLPTAISGVNSYWARGYGSPPPQTLVVVGFELRYIEPYFESCKLAGQITNRYEVQNEESHVADIFVCRGLQLPWAEFWRTLRRLG